MPASDVLEELYALDPCSSDFPRTLFSFIKSDEEEQYSKNLEGEELTRLMDFLDNALCSIPTTDDVFRQCLRKLRAICGLHTALPSSHVIEGAPKKIGESPAAFGGFAEVWKGEHGGNQICIKILRIAQNDSASLKKSFFKEAVVWKRLRHSNIVPFLGVTIKPLQFISEWMPNGTLTEYVVKVNPDANRICLALDVAEGLNYLHSNYTIHGDLKGPNILINAKGHACLTDFGLTSVAQGHSSIQATRPNGYTPRWTAPEILMGAEKTTRQADIFSFGMVMIETFTGKIPLSEWPTHSVTVRIVQGQRPLHPKGTEELGFVAPIWNMTVDCWNPDPSFRPSMAAIVEFLRESYTLHKDTDPKLLTLPPWKPKIVNHPGYGYVSPGSADGGISPTQTAAPFFQMFPIQEHSTMHPSYQGVSYATQGSFEDSLSDDSRLYSNQVPMDYRGHRKQARSSASDDSAQGRAHLNRNGSFPPPGNTSPISQFKSGNAKPRQQGDKETPPQKGVVWRVTMGLAKWRARAKNSAVNGPGN